MTLYQFNRLDELEQLEALWENGVVVAEREDEPRMTGHGWTQMNTDKKWHLLIGEDANNSEYYLHL